MRRSVKFFVITLLLILPSIQARADFKNVVATIERSTTLQRLRIPFFGLARAFVKTTHPDGIYDVKLAVFEGNTGRLPSTFVDSIRDALGSDWQPMVMVQSRRDNEVAHIFAQPSKRGMRLLIVALENRDATVVEVEVDPEHIDDLLEGKLDLGF